MVGTLRQSIDDSLQAQQVDEFRIVRIGDKMHLGWRGLRWWNLHTKVTNIILLEYIDIVGVSCIVLPVAMSFPTAFSKPILQPPVFGQLFEDLRLVEN